MSKNPKPTTEELRFVYKLILDGNDDADILEEYYRQYDSGTLMFPFRTDKRFVRERRKELLAAEEVFKERLGKKYDPLTIENKRQHFEHLSLIAKILKA